jgi:7,8-dihydropterin-6-yl-methyl-4-(beta-D-ribofuranosyl)aminobenzene 5'-phosphate synthase
MRRALRSATLLLICYSVFILAENALGQNVVVQNPVGQTRALPTASDQNSILNLYDAFGYQKRGTVLDWGFSALVHYNGKTILFDTGNNADSFEHNVKALGVDLNQVDIAVLSHHHVDHISGFVYVLKIKPTVTALGAPFHYTISKETKESLAGLPPEQLYFGGGSIP